MSHEADVIAIRHAYGIAGKDAALFELRRRLMHISEQAAPAVLAKVLRLPVTMPPEFRRDDMKVKPGVIRAYP